MPDRKLYAHPAKTAPYYKTADITFESSDKTPLHAWHLPARTSSPRGTILQFHGNAENLSSHWTYLAWLVDEGFDLVIFDYRGYGQSGGEAFPEGAVQDGVAALAMARKIQIERKSPRLIAVGQSLGGNILLAALEWQSHHQTSAVVIPDGLILDSTFASYKSVAKQKAGFLGRLLVSDRYAPTKEFLQKLTIPKIILHDRTDPIVDSWNGQALFEGLAPPKELWLTDMGRHVGATLKDQPRRRTELIDWIIARSAVKN